MNRQTVETKECKTLWTQLEGKKKRYKAYFNLEDFYQITKFQTNFILTQNFLMLSIFNIDSQYVNNMSFDTILDKYFSHVKTNL